MEPPPVIRSRLDTSSLGLSDDDLKSSLKILPMIPSLKPRSDVAQDGRLSSVPKQGDYGWLVGRNTYSY